MDLKYMVLKYEWPYKRLDISLWIIHHQVLNHNLPRQSLSHSLISWLIAELLWKLGYLYCPIHVSFEQGLEKIINAASIKFASYWCLKVFLFAILHSLNFGRLSMCSIYRALYIWCPMENLSINDDQLHTLNYLRLCFVFAH